MCLLFCFCSSIFLLLYFELSLITFYCYSSSTSYFTLTTILDQPMGCGFTSLFCNSVISIQWYSYPAHAVCIKISLNSVLHQCPNQNILCHHLVKFKYLVHRECTMHNLASYSKRLEMSLEHI